MTDLAWGVRLFAAICGAGDWGEGGRPNEIRFALAGVPHTVFAEALVPLGSRFSS